jgi:uncharacterized membrane protein YphA (DoxX/SURF4 family)
VPHRFSIGLATVVMLVLLRLNIGWHFFSEGVKHYSDPHWTSEPSLRSAKGPLASWYQAYLPDFHGFEELLHGKGTESGPHAAQAWVDAIQSDWHAYAEQFTAHYALNDVQQKQADEILHQYQAKVRAWAADNKDALATHVHQWQRKETTRGAPAGDVPFQKQRMAEKQALLSAEASSWLAELKGLERTYDNALDGLLESGQRRAGPLAHHTTSVDTVDDVMKYVILGIGLLLLLGLFTRLACVIGAVFLFSVVMMQPFWVSEALPTYNQFVEMFALLALATTRVGRWGGLDFFLANLFARPLPLTEKAKGKSHVSQS